MAGMTVVDLVSLVLWLAVACGVVMGAVVLVSGWAWVRHAQPPGVGRWVCQSLRRSNAYDQ